MKIALIGFGEAGQMFGKGLAQKNDVHAYDIKITETMRKTASESGVTLSGNQDRIISQADYIFSLVTADQATLAANSAATFLTPHQIYFEMNSVAPDTKRSNAKLIPSLVDVAIMAPVHPHKMNVPLLLSHPNVARHVTQLTGLGFNAKIAGEDIGKAAAIKLCRSIMIKGMEALTVECLSTSNYYGVEKEVLASLHASFPEMGWDKDRADYWFERVTTHGKRRAAEMREAAKMVAQTGVCSQMALETSKTQDLFTDTEHS